MLRHPMVAGLGRKRRRLVAKNHDDLVFDVESGVIVVLKLVGRNAIARKHERALRSSRRRKTERNKILLGPQFFLLCSGLHYKVVVTFQLGAGNDREGLEIGVRARGFEPKT